MKKDLLFYNFNSGKKTMLVFLFTLFTCYTAFAQNRQITGNIIAEDGLAIPGASIKIKGTATGVVTDVKGSFKLSVPDNATLVFSFLGYISQEIQVGSGRLRYNQT
jgi:hypothetical protein